MHWEGLRDGASESKAYLKGYYKYLNRLRGPVVRISARNPPCVSLWATQHF